MGSPWGCYSHMQSQCLTFLAQLVHLLQSQVWAGCLELCGANSMPCIAGNEVCAEGDTWKSTISASKWRSNFRDSCPSS